MNKTIHLLFGGDVMLGRLVRNAIAEFGAAYPLSAIHHLLQHGDLTIVNL